MASSKLSDEDWVTAPIPQSQTSWLFYAVTRIRGSYVPVAVTAYSPAPIKKYPEVLASEHLSHKVTGVVYGHQIATSALACVRIFSEPANRQFILAEMDMASEHYSNMASILVPEINLPEQRHDLYDTVRGVISDGATFPFIQTCLEHGAAADAIDAGIRADCWRLTMPLRMAYRRHPSFGAVIIDITDLNDVGYGIIASEVLNQTKPGYEISDEAAVKNYKKIRQVLGQDQERRVLGVSEYLRLADNDGSCCAHLAKQRIEADIEALSQIRTVGMGVLHVIWPDGKRTAKSVEPRAGRVSSLFDIAWRGVAPADQQAGDSLRFVSRMAPFREQLPERLRDMHVPLFRGEDDSYNNDNNGALLQMLCSKLDLAGDVCIVRPYSITTEFLEEVLGVASMPDVDDTVSLCLGALLGDNMSEGDYVTQLLEQAKCVYVLQPGDQANEELSFKVRSKLDEIVPNARIVFSDMYSASLRRMRDDDELGLLRGFDRAAVDRVIVRRETPWRPYNQQEKEHRYHVEHWQMGAEAWVARMLSWLRNLDANGRGLACGPTSLKDMGAKIMSPSLYPIVKERSEGRSKWTLLVLIRATPHDSNYVQYAFVRKDPDADTEKDPDAYQVEDAYGVMEAEKPGAADKDLLDAELATTRRAIVAWPKFGIKTDPQREESALTMLTWEDNKWTILRMLRGLIGRRSPKGRGADTDRQPGQAELGGSRTISVFAGYAI